jgi:hypothetical protein
MVVFFADSSTAQDNRIYRLEPKVLTSVPGGKIAVVAGKATSKPYRFFLDNLNMLIPVSVVLIPETPGERVDIAIGKDGRQAPDRADDTRKGPVNFRFRTQGEFQIAVTAVDKPTDYRLVIWVGEEVKPDFAPIVVKRSEFREPSRNPTDSPVP